jgi:hypothetical protein
MLITEITFSPSKCHLSLSSPKARSNLINMSHRSIAMGNAGKYRANAIHCFQMADKAFDPNDEQNWLSMAETWLGMIPERQRTPNEIFEKAVRNQGTRQEPSKSRH